MFYRLYFFILIAMLGGCTSNEIKETRFSQDTRQISYQLTLDALPPDADKRERNLRIQSVYLQSGMYLDENGELRSLVNSKPSHAWRGGDRPKINHEDAVFENDNSKKVKIFLPK